MNDARVKKLKQRIAQLEGELDIAKRMKRDDAEVGMIRIQLSQAKSDLKKEENS